MKHALFHCIWLLWRSGGDWFDTEWNQDYGWLVIRSMPGWLPALCYAPKNLKTRYGWQIQSKSRVWSVVEEVEKEKDKLRASDSFNLWFQTVLLRFKPVLSTFLSWRTTVISEIYSDRIWILWQSLNYCTTSIWIYPGFRKPTFWNSCHTCRYWHGQDRQFARAGWCPLRTVIVQLCSA